MSNYVIGAGGVGSWLVPRLARLDRDIKIVDGDTLEKKNLDRQFFSDSMIGVNKASALAGMYGLSDCSIPEYYTVGLLQLDRKDWLWCCADNHACRREVLAACDLYRCSAIIMANEYIDAEAYIFTPDLAGTPNDPRVFYPEITTDRSGDPLGPPGCVELSRSNRQLVVANALAADMGLWLYWFWTKEAGKMPPDTKQFWPIMHKASINSLKTIRFNDRLTG